MNTITLHQGHTLHLLQALPAASIHCAITSPPYWGLRDYGLEPQVWMLPDTDCPGHEWGENFVRTDASGENRNVPAEWQRPSGANKAGNTSHQFCRLCGAWRGSFGMEPTLDCLGWATGNPCGQCYICHSLQIYREVRRVLRPDGTFWLNIGDSYNGSGGAGGDYNPGGLKAGQPRYPGRNAPGLKPKDLCGVPFRLALALQADGWWLRTDVIEKVKLYCPCGCGYELEEEIIRYSQDREIIWDKTNPMPESCTDRPTRAHEYIFLLTKSQKYFYDAEAVREAQSNGTHERFGKNNQKTRDGSKGRKLAKPGSGTKNNSSFDAAMREMIQPDGKRNLRSVWTLATEPFPGAHFATFPTSIPEKCIKAGTSEKGCCPKCGAPWQRVVEKKFKPQEDISLARGIKGAPGQKPLPDTQFEGYPRDTNETSTTGWQPTCTCPHTAHDLIPATVLDPFSGAGTTCLVAAKLQRKAIGLELNPDYLEMSRQRLARELGAMLVEIEVATP